MLRAVSTAFFLACSWFWCIGGFFPILLERDFGQIALPFFMVFNVVGAALFGMIWNETTRAKFLEKTLFFARGFSVIVAGYHFVFVSWISVMLGDLRPLIGYIVITLFFILFRNRLRMLAIGVFSLTLVLFAVIQITYRPDFVVNPPVNPFLHQILPLALGFLVAPYFDLTFHRAFAESPYPRLSFLLGFGVFFAVLLVGVFIDIPEFAQLLSAPALSQPSVAFVVGLLVLQTGFTTAAHLREIVGIGWSQSWFWPSVLATFAGLSGLHLIVGYQSAALIPAIGELVYRSFIFVVGVIFPVILIFDGLSRYSAMVMTFLTVCYTLGFLVGGVYAPLLSVGIAGLAVAYWSRSRFILDHPR